MATSLEIEDQIPVQGATGVCRNVIADLVFNQAVSPSSLENNIVLLKNPSTPEPPSNLNLFNISINEIYINWKDNSFNEDQFIVERRLNSGVAGKKSDFSIAAAQWQEIANLPANTFYYRDKSVEEGKNYIYRVYSSNDKHGYSSPSNYLEIGINDCSYPSTETRSCSCSNINHATNCQSERHCLNKDLWGSWSQCRAINCEPNYAPSQEGECLPVSPDKPENFEILEVFENQIKFSWTDVYMESGYEIKRSFSMGGCEADNGSINWDNCNIYDSLEKNNSEFIDNNVNPNSLYFYKVRACNEIGCSPWSTVLSIHSSPTIPTNFSIGDPIINDDNTIDIRLSWDTVSGADSYKINYTTSENTSGLIEAPSNSDQLLDEDLIPGANYSYKIKSCNNNICSHFSNEKDINIPGTPPQAPTNLTIIQNQVTENQIPLTWSDFFGADKYRLYQALDQSGCNNSWDNCNWIKEVYSGGYVVEGLMPETEYFYKVKSCNNSGCSDFSNIVSATTAPNNPSGLQAQCQEAGEIILSFIDNSSTEDGFRIERKSTDQDWSEAISYQLGDNLLEEYVSFTDTDVMVDEVYNYRVLAYRGNKESSYSNIISILSRAGEQDGQGGGGVSLRELDKLDKKVCQNNFLNCNQEQDLSFHIAASNEDTNIPVNIKINTFINNEGKTELSIIPQEVLDPNADYEIFIQGGINGVKSEYNIPMEEAENWSFRTGDEICSLDNIDFNIDASDILDENYKFSSPTVINIFEENTGLNFIAKPQSGNMQIFPVENIYEWNWAWGSSVEDVAGITNSSNDNPSQASALIGEKNGVTEIASQATITIDQINSPHTIGKKTLGNGQINVMICDNPWFYENPETHFKTFYCRDGDPVLPGLIK